MESNVEIVVEATENLKSKSKGRYFENIAELCQTKHGWSNATTSAALEEASKQKKIFSSIVNGKLSYRKCDKKLCIEDDSESRFTQTDPLPTDDSISLKDLDRIHTDLEDFKRYTHGEILSMKAEVANRQKSPNPHSMTRMDKDREALVRSLQERILSLEKQLQDKQYIIERLLDGPRHRSTNITTGPYTIPNGSTSHATSTTIIEGETARTKDLENTKELDAKSFERNANSGNKDAKQQQKQSSSTKSKQTASKTRKRIAIIGDSMLNGIYEEGMQKDHNVKIKPHSGATTRDIVDYLKPVTRKKPDCIIIHAGTNDLTSQDQIDTEKNFHTIIEDVKRDSPGTVIVLSTAVMRKDKQALDKKVSVSELNTRIKKIAKAQNISVIDNSSLDVSCLSRKKLHLNEKGNSYLANNFIKFLKDF